MQRLLREELGYEGVILSDDLEMKAVSASLPVPEAAVQAIQAGCDGLLVCAGNVDVQVATLEALIKAVEAGEISRARLADATGRLRRAKERFLMGDRPTTSARMRALRAVIGRDEHQAIAAEMASFL